MMDYHFVTATILNRLAAIKQLKHSRLFEHSNKNKQNQKQIRQTYNTLSLLRRGLKG